MARAGIALGSNLGDRELNLTRAIGMLRAISVPGADFLTASFHETEPWSCPPLSPLFLNTVIEMEYDREAMVLLETLLSFEATLGRVRLHERNAPRTIDLDLLYLGETTLADEALILPHPRIPERRFVLEPLAEIRPGLVLPGYRLSVRDMLDRLLHDERNQQAPSKAT